MSRKFRGHPASQILIDDASLFTQAVDLLIETALRKKAEWAAGAVLPYVTTEPSEKHVAEVFFDMALPWADKTVYTVTQPTREDFEKTIRAIKEDQ